MGSSPTSGTTESKHESSAGHDRSISSGQGIEYTAVIHCASVTPEVVRFSYIIPENQSTVANQIAGLEVLWVIRDGGSPGFGNDSAYYVYGAPGTIPDCDDGAPPLPTSNMLNGNFTVHEASD